jgi:hypothetical protein
MKNATGIGGFIGLEPPSSCPTGSAQGPGAALRFRNARAALAHLLSWLAPPRVWLPAYICAEAAAAAARDGREVRFYRVGGDLTPDASGLESQLRPGDAVIGVDYFGAPAQGLPELAERLPDIPFIQDCAQGLWPAPEPWGRWLIYSPRKVVGVPDGGLLVSRAETPPPPRWARPPAGIDHLAPALMRFEDAAGAHNDVWYDAYRQAEARMTADPLPMSRLSGVLLEALDLEAAARRRRANAAALMSALGEHGLWPAERLLAGAPLGVPVLAPDAGGAAQRMAQRRIYCARHWSELPSSADDFPDEQQLSRRLLTLPCDQRYDPGDMAEVAAAFLACR